MALEGPGSHGTLHAGGRKTTVKDRRKEIGKRLPAKMLADLEMEREDFLSVICRRCLKDGEPNRHV